MKTLSYKSVFFAGILIKNMKKIIASTLLIILSVTIGYAQEDGIQIVQDGKFSPNTVFQSTTPIDSTSKAFKKQQRKLEVAKRNLHYNILGGPSYTPDFGVLIGGTALLTFKMNPSDSLQLRSVIPSSIAVMLNGGVSFQSKPQLFFKEDKFRIFGQFSYKNSLENFYGVGFNTNKDWVRSDSTSRYRYSGMQINPWFLFRIKETGFFIGPQIDITLDKMMKPAKYMTEIPSYVHAGGTEHGYKNFSSGLGVLLSYDTRDIPANAYKGVYLNFQGMLYQKFLGSNDNFYRLDIDYRQYKSVGNRKVIAWTLQTKNVFGDVPLNKYSLAGTPFDLRGYYTGQYRDKSAHLGIVEYRQMFNTDQSNWFKKIVNHLGFVVWGGCGFMGPNPVKIEGVLPNFGAGLRIEIQKRMNVRFDIGRNTVNKQNLFYFNMTEAF